MTAATRRLLFISHSREVGGAEVYLEKLVRHIAAAGGDLDWRATLVCRRDHVLDSWAAEISESCEVVRLDVTSARDLRQLAKLVREADLVHLNLSFPSGKYQFAAALITRMLGRPLVVTHHLALRVPAPWRVAMRWLGGAARSHIAVSRRSRNVLIQEFGYNPEHVVVVHNGIDADSFKPASEEARRAIRRIGGETLDGQAWGDDVLLACTVARLSPQKGLFDLIDATAIVVQAVPTARMVVIGEGELRQRLVEHVRAHGVERYFFLAGAMPHERVAQWLAAADLFILPSHYEGGPATALMEAMACGCAVVTTNVSGVEEIITDAALGAVVPPRNAAALAAATVELLIDAGQRAAMAARGRSKVNADFSIAASLQLTLAVFDAAVAGERTAPA
jgi:glycosyltransferase involved in cell wall biosynthesis